MVTKKSKKAGKSNGNGNGTGSRRPARIPNRQRQRRMNGNAMRSTAISYAGAMSNQRPVNNAVHAMRGSDFYSTVEVLPNISGAGRIIAKIPISPSQFPGTRLTQLADLWEFFKFTKFHLRWVPAVPTTLACQFVLYMDLDPSDDPTLIANEDALIRQAVAQTGAQQWNFHVPKTIPLAMRADRQYYFTGSDKQNIRFTQQGAAYLIQITNPINFNGENIPSPIQAGSLFIDWAVNFSTPQINPSAAVVASLPQLGLQSRLTTAPATELEPGENDYTISGFIPRRYYGVSLMVSSAVPASTGSILLYDTRSGLQASFLRIVGQSDSVAMNFVSPGSGEAPGYFVSQANDDGEIEARIDVAGISPTALSACQFAFMPIFEETPFTSPPRVLRLPNKDGDRSHLWPKAPDFGPCPIREYDTTDCNPDLHMR